MPLLPLLPQLLAGLPTTLPDLLAALTAPGDGERPWLAAHHPITTDDVDAWTDVIEALAPSLHGTDTIDQHQALKVLTLCPIPVAGEQALPFLSDSRVMFPPVACDAVARSGMAGAKSALEALTVHEDPGLRWRAAGNLGLVSEPGVADILQRILERDDDPLVLRWAAVSLGETGGPGAHQALLRVVERVDHPQVRLGVDAGLEALGRSRDDLALPMAQRDLLAAAQAGDDAALAQLLASSADPSSDPLTAAAIRGAAAAADDLTEALVRLLRGGRRPEKFVAADVLGLRGGEIARAALEEKMSSGYDPAIFLAVASGLERAGDESAAQRFADRWLDDIDPPDRAAEAGRVLDLSAPVPGGLLVALLRDPCAFVVAAAAEVVRREEREDVLAVSLEVLREDLERIAGDREPRDPYENGFGSAERLTRQAVEAGRAIRTALPEGLASVAEALEKEHLIQASVLAARSLLRAVVDMDEVADSAIAACLKSPNPLLRFEALGHSVARTRALPTPGLAQDPHPAVRRFWEALGRT